MPRSNAWKNLEKTVANVLGGVRIHRGGDFSESLPDVIAPTETIFGLPGRTHAIVAECKYRAKHPWISKFKKLVKINKQDSIVSYLEIPTTNLLTDMDDTMIIVSLDQFKDLFLKSRSLATPIRYSKDIPGYLHAYCSQSRSYINDLETRLTTQLLYYKLSKDLLRPKFESYSSIAVIGQRNDSLRLVVFYKSEFYKVVNASDSGKI